MKHGTGIVSNERLRLSKAPVAELAEAALRAQNAGAAGPIGDEPLAFVVVAVPAGALEEADLVIRSALGGA